MQVLDIYICDSQFFYIVWRLVILWRETEDNFGKRVFKEKSLFWEKRILNILKRVLSEMF